MSTWGDRTDVAIGISKAPDDPKEKEKWAHQMANIQISMWIGDGATCAHCGHRYSGVDDFRRCNPRSGGFDKQKKNFNFVCDSCWDEYSKTYQEKC